MKFDFLVFDETQRLYIPYRAGAGCSSPNVGFIDLKAEPERIIEIHELKGYPELEKLIRFLNRPDCIFRTARIDTALNFEQRPNLPRLCFAALTFGLELGTVDDVQYYRDLYLSFQNYAARYPIDDVVEIKFILVPLTVVPTDVQGWCLEIRVYSFGGTDKWARQRWAQAITLIHEFLAIEAGRWEQDEYIAKQLEILMRVREAHKVKP